MYYAFALCGFSICIIAFVLYLLNRHKKLGTLENEVKFQEIANKILETIRETQANSATLNRDQRDERMRKYDQTDT